VHTIVDTFDFALGCDRSRHVGILLLALLELWPLTGPSFQPVMRRHGAQPQKREALRTPYLKIGNLRLRSNLHDALDANRTRFAALYAKPVEHVAG
jgi:hypothetical protein